MELNMKLYNPDKSIINRFWNRPKRKVKVTLRYFKRFIKEIFIPFVVGFYRMTKYYFTEKTSATYYECLAVNYKFVKQDLNNLINVYKLFIK